jgi:hypothetical protein
VNRVARQLLRTPTLALALPLLLTTLAAQEGAEAKPVPVPPPPAKLAEWPALADTDKDRVAALVGQFRKPDPQLHEAAKKGLVALGEGAMPQLFTQVADRADNVNKQLFAVFDEVLAPRHAALLAREVKKPRVELRRYLVIRLCRFTDPEMLPVLQTTMNDKDEVTAFHAALGALAVKHKDALAPVMTYAKSHWSEVAATIAEVLPAARGEDQARWVFEAIAKAPVADQMTGLRLLRYLAAKSQTPTLRPYLDAKDNTVKKEAVNAMRVLHGEAPIENMPVFQVIEMAKAWQKKV